MSEDRSPKWHRVAPVAGCHALAQRRHEWTRRVAPVARNRGAGTAQEVTHSGVSTHDSALCLNCRRERIESDSHGRRSQDLSLIRQNLLDHRPTGCTAIGATLLGVFHWSDDA